MAHVSRFRHQVRSYELDSYGHVNNAVFMQWLEHGRSGLLQDHGFNYNNVEQRWGIRFVLVSTRIDFKAGLSLADEVEVTTEVSRVGTTSATFSQRVLRGDEEAATCETVVVFTDPSMQTPVPIPDEFKDLYA